MIESTRTALDAAFAQNAASERLPAAAAALVRDGRIVWTGAHRADPSTQFRIGSITKTLVAVAVLQLRDEGALALSDPIGRHLPELPFPFTITQLLTHTSGLSAESAGSWWERSPGASWATLAAGLELVHEPGTRFHYSNTGYGVLGELVARLRGTDWLTVVRERILEPLGMDRTSAMPESPFAEGLAVHPTEHLVLSEPTPDAGAMAPAGQLWCSVEDLAAWAAFVAQGDDRVLATSTLREMQVPLAVDDRLDLPWATAQGLGFRVWNDGRHGQRRFAGHGGSMPGFIAVLKVDLESGDGVVAMGSSTHQFGPIADTLLETWWAADPPAASDAPEVLPDVEPLLGSWFWGPREFVLEAHADGFILGDSPEGRRSRFVRDGDRWRGLDGYFAGERLHLRDDGAIELATFVLARSPYDPAVRHPGGAGLWRPAPTGGE